jgi:hypothetical protein
MTDPRGMFDGSFPSDAYPKLEGTSGTVELSFPLRYVFDEPELARPIQLKFMLIERGTVDDRVPIADTRYFEYVHP